MKANNDVIGGTYATQFRSCATIDDVAAEELLCQAEIAIHRWPREWWVAMLVKAGLIPLGENDRCVQVALDGRQCYRNYLHEGSCGFVGHARWITSITQ